MHFGGIQGRAENGLASDSGANEVIPKRACSPQQKDVTRLYTGVDYLPSSTEADCIISGRLEKFPWNVFHMPTMFIPVVNLILYSGVPMVSFTHCFRPSYAWE